MSQSFFFTHSALAVVSNIKKTFFLCSTCFLLKRLCFRCALIENSVVSKHIVFDSKQFQFQIIFLKNRSNSTKLFLWCQVGLKLHFGYFIFLQKNIQLKSSTSCRFHKTKNKT
jgi:hypothetical protein